MAELAANGEETTGAFKNYIFFWSGQMVSLLGSAIVQFVIIWWITIRTRSALYLSIANIAGFLPFILLTPVAGVFVDRWSRKALIGSADFLQAAFTVGLAMFFMFEDTIFNYPNYAFNFDVGSYIYRYDRFLANTGPMTFIWVVLGFLAIRGSFQAFQVPAIQAIIPIMVPRKHLNRMNGIDFLFNGVIGLIGPVIAALLLAINFLDIGDLLWIDVITFSVAVIPLVLIKIPSVTKTEKKEKKETTFFQEFKEGIVFIKNKRGLFALLGVFTAANLCITPLFTLINLYVYAGHLGNATNLALVLAFFQGGMIGASVFMVIWKGFKKKVIGVAGGILVTYAGFLMITFTPQGLFWFMGIGALIMGLTLPIMNLSSQYIWQTVVPKEKLGRVMAVRQTLAQFSAPFGMILSGLIVHFLEKKAESSGTEVNAIATINPVFWGAIALGTAMLLFSWFFTNMRHVEEDLDFDKSPDEPPVLEIEEQTTSTPLDQVDK
ncbi:MAG: MFS transporter [Candidatus Heimdallarchaeaceae archaeon]